MDGNPLDELTAVHGQMESKQREVAEIRRSIAANQDDIKRLRNEKEAALLEVRSLREKEREVRARLGDALPDGLNLSTGRAGRPLGRVSLLVLQNMHKDYPVTSRDVSRVTGEDSNHVRSSIQYLERRGYINRVPESEPFAWTLSESGSEKVTS